VGFELPVQSIKISDNSEYEKIVSTLMVKLPTEKQGKGF
jgi:hypothetical protein